MTAKRSEFLPFSKPSISDADIAAVTDVLRSGWITTGRRNTEFEAAFCAYTGAKHSIALASATGGMHIMLKALGLGPGDEVLTPSMTWVSTVNLVVLAGATPVFVDVDRDTLIASPSMFSEKVTSRTKAMIPVHFAGAPADLHPLRRMASDIGIPLIEDAAHAVGTEYMGRLVGSDGTAIFSFHPIKNITTGEGGMICTDDDRLAERLRQLKFHGLGVDAFDRQTQGRAPQAEVLEPGYKYNLTDIGAALGLGQLSRLVEFNRKRSELAALYRARLAGVDEILPLREPAYTMKHAWHLFIVRVDTDKARMSRDAFMRELKERNIGTGLHFRAVHLQKYYREKMGMKPGLLPATEWNSDRICSLPLFPDMTPEDVTDAVDAIKDVLSKR